MNAQELRSMKQQQQLRQVQIKRADAWAKSALKMRTPTGWAAALSSAAMWYRDAGLMQHARACEIAKKG